MGAHYLEEYADHGLYVMQGRLSPPENGRFQSFPRATWQTEIDLAAQVPLRGIEWIFDLYGEGANPLETPEGRADLRQRLARAGTAVVSICADYFMDCPLVRIADAQLRERVTKLEWLVSICPGMGITRVVLPFVDASRIADGKDAEDVLRALNAVLPQATRLGVELHLEADLDPPAFKAFLDRIEHPFVKVNYDSGNSGSLGYSPLEEFAAYGSRIGSFHIKDRVLGGGTVPLGKGNVDFATLREALIDCDYRGDFVLQTARGAAGDEAHWLRETAGKAAGWLRGDITIGP